ncbi:MAG: phosphatidate cytidylyltransferase [Limibacillus sp.]
MQASQPDKSSSGLLPRALAALVMAPPVLLALYCGSPYLDLLVYAGLAILAAEWALLCDHQKKGVVLAVILVGTLASLFALRQLGTEPGLGVLAVSAALVTLIGQRVGGSPRLLFLGSVYLPMACFSFLWLRGQPEGLALAFWVMTAVWATDVGAYAAGRGIGGPKLLPSISPKKTWAGLLGGMAASGTVSLIAGLLVEPWDPLALLVLGALLAVVAQAGDFLESGIKRYFGVKDASHLIPGHGGLLDRVDGLLMASLGVAALVYLLRDAGHGWL